VSPAARNAGGVVLLMLAALACRPRGAEGAGPERAALELFALARSTPRDEGRVEARFEVGPEDPRWASLLETLDGIADARAPQITDVQPLADLDRVAVDLYAELAGGAVARYSVQLGRGADGGWKVRWFHGPGPAWPRQRPGRGEGLTTSPPPG